MNFAALPRSFYARDTHAVARDLLGKLLVRRWRGADLVGRITEVEAYVGENDAACHASRGRTKRTEVMFGPAGCAYVYLIYGMYDCLNVVTEAEGFPAAALIRSVEPLQGVAAMQRARGGARVKPDNLTTGPGKLTQALRITRAFNGEDVTASGRLLVCEDVDEARPITIATSPRIGVAYAGEDALLPWRYYLADSQFISRR